MHLFDYPAGNLMESSFTTAGQEIVVDTTCIDGVNLGVSTCYDMRFPSLYQNLVAAGAEILLMPSAFTVKTGMAHWEIILRCRAIETQSCVINISGQNLWRTKFFGGQNFRRQAKFSAILSAEFLSDKVYRFFLFLFFSFQFLANGNH